MQSGEAQRSPPHLVEGADRMVQTAPRPKKALCSLLWSGRCRRRRRSPWALPVCCALGRPGPAVPSAAPDLGAGRKAPRSLLRNIPTDNLFLS